MTVKTITITETAYESIKRLKSERESFSDLFLRLGSTFFTAKDIRGILKLTPEQAAEFRTRVYNSHKRLGEGLRKRIPYVRTRLEHTHRTHS